MPPASNIRLLINRQYDQPLEQNRLKFIFNTTTYFVDLLSLPLNFKKKFQAFSQFQDPMGALL